MPVNKLEDEIEKDNRLVAGWLLWIDERRAEKRGKSAKWVALIEEIELELPRHLRAFLILRRQYRDQKGRKCWTVTVEVKLQEQEIFVESRQTLADWWKKIVNITARIAGKRGLLQ
jgi:hypothetical protein